MPFIEIPLEYWLLIAGIIIVGLSWACCRLYENMEHYRKLSKTYFNICEAREDLLIALMQGIREDEKKYESQISYLLKMAQGLRNRINAIHRQYKK